MENEVKDAAYVPTVFQKHVYDVDVLHAFKELTKRCDGRRSRKPGIAMESAIQIYWESIIEYSRRLGLNLNEYSNGGYLVVPSSDDFYPAALAMVPRQRLL